ncbi:hypothetical protein SRHO_G00308580 [Serrasalmus rhombeus]
MCALCPRAKTLSIPTAIKARFAEVLQSETAVLAAVTLPRFKLRWLRTQERKDNAKASLLAECRRITKDEDQPTGTNAPTHHLSTNSATEDDFFFPSRRRRRRTTPLLWKAKLVTI